MAFLLFLLIYNAIIKKKGGENKMAKKDKLIRTQKIKIKKGHKLFNYFSNICYQSKNLYNNSKCF